MTGTQLAAFALAAVLVLAGVNFSGVDPGDFVLVAMLPLVLLLRPGAALLPRVGAVVRVLLFAFLASYVVSVAANEFRVSFVLNFALNLGFFLLAYAVATRPRARPFDASRPLLLGFFASVGIAVALKMAADGAPGFLFDLVRDHRFMGLVGDPNLLGLLAVIVILLVLDRIVALGFRHGAGAIIARVLQLVGALAVLLATQSRSAWVALVGALVVYVYLVAAARRGTPRAASFVLVGALGIVGGAFAVFSLGDSFESARRAELDAAVVSDAEDERFQFLYTAASVAVGIQRPVGVGPGMTAAHTGFTNLDGDPIGGHNAFVQVFTENGFLAAAVLAVLIATTSLRLRRKALAGETFLGISCRVLLCGSVATAVVGLAHDLLAWRIAWVMPTLAILAASLRPPARVPVTFPLARANST